MVERLSDLQKGILKQVAEGEEKGIIMRKVAAELGKHVPSVHGSLKLLVENKMLLDPERAEGVAKPLKLTDKGALYAVHVCNVNPESMLKNHPHLVSESEKPALKTLKTLGIDDIYFGVMSKVSVDNDLFDKDGNSLLDERRYPLVRYQHFRKTIMVEMAYQVQERMLSSQHLSQDQVNRLAKSIITFIQSSKLFTESEIKQVRTILVTH